MGSSVGHGYVGIQKFNTLMNIPKRVTAKSITKKLIDCVNVVDIIVYRYWDNKLEFVGHYQKQVGTRLWNLKIKEKGLSGRCCLTDTANDRL